MLFEDHNNQPRAVSASQRYLPPQADCADSGPGSLVLEDIIHDGFEQNTRKRHPPENYVLEPRLQCRPPGGSVGNLETL